MLNAYFRPFGSGIGEASVSGDATLRVSPQGFVEFLRDRSAQSENPCKAPVDAGRSVGKRVRSVRSRARTLKDSSKDSSGLAWQQIVAISMRCPRFRTHQGILFLAPG